MGLKGLFSVARCVLNTAFDCRCMNYKFSVKKEVSSVCVFHFAVCSRRVSLIHADLSRVI